MSDTGTRTPLDLAALRRRLAERRGRDLWRSLEELADDPGFAEALRHEFPRHAAAMLEAVDRRQFLKLMGASLALAGLGACTRQPTEKIVPYVRPPEEIVAGVPLFFATAMPLAGGACGLLVESHLGRPTKIEGNPEHPASLGATGAVAQASILDLYDPDRSQVVTSAGEIRPWTAFVASLRTALETQRARGGAGLRLLTETVTSPTLAQQIRDLLTELPGARWHQWEPVAHDGARRALGAIDAQYRIAEADVILALDADFLACDPTNTSYAREFAARRHPPAAEHDGHGAAAGAGERGMNRLYVVESTPTVTGSVADHRLAVRASEIEAFGVTVAAALAGRLDVEGLDARAAWIAALARDLQAHRGRSLVIAGAQQPQAVHEMAHRMNAALGNVGTTVVYTEAVAAEPVDAMASLRALAEDMAAERVEMLLILGGNPVYDAPADLEFAKRLANVRLRVHLSSFEDETSLLCHWHVPQAHYLEAWSDTRAFDGTVTIMQPLIAPLYEGKSAHEVLAALSPRPERSGYDVVREYWQGRAGGGDFETFWRKALHDGVVPDTAAAPATPVVRVPGRGIPDPIPADALEIVFRPDPSVFDGRFANNGWLQELPKPLTKLTWDNAALVSPATAERFGLASEDVVELGHGGRSVTAPVWVVPGQADGSVTVHLGYGRTRVGRLGNGAGFDAYRLRTADAPWFATGLELRKTGGRHPLATTQEHHDMAGRHLVRATTLADYREHPHFAHELGHEPPEDLTLYPRYEYPSPSWGMAIDLGACTGCNACMVACQAENNVAVVGKDEVARGREMHWLRIDRYFEGDLDAPRIHHQPVPCMQCENAPCELVCPVNATVHTDDGLNAMIYNRCVGTRYCSNNCPYKVRRFNFYLYSDWDTESLKLQRNPDVTVRSRGVMEKCTYCVQRISRARIDAAREDRPIRDGEVVTACQQACPSEAIVFGDVADPGSRVSKLKADPRNYGLLADLNTRPRTTYLAAVRNPNPEIAS